MMKLRILSGEQIREVFSMTDMIDAMQEAFIELSNGRTEMPLRSHIHIEEPEGTALFMPSYLISAGMIGVKTVTLFEDNRKNSLPYIQGMICLFDGKNGSPKCVLDGTTITALRTGAASGLATRLLARKESSICTIFGAGIQGRTQLEAVCAVRDIKRVFVFDNYRRAAEKYTKEMEKTLGVEIIIADSPELAVRDTDVICCATISQSPVFMDKDLPRGVHINAVGSYKPHVQEVPEEMVLRARLYVDHRVSALEETGDLIIPITKGLMTPDHIIAEIGEVASAKASGRISDDDITFFKSVGVAVQDLAAATTILKKAEQLGIGTTVSF